MENNLGELNDILFETLRDVKNGTADTKQANSIIGISNALINNAKVQLNAFKIAGGKRAPEFFALPEAAETKNSKKENKYDLMEAFAIEKNYDNVTHAMGAMGKENFNKEFETWIG